VKAEWYAIEGVWPSKLIF